MFKKILKNIYKLYQRMENWEFTKIAKGHSKGEKKNIWNNGLSIKPAETYIYTCIYVCMYVFYI